MKKTDHAKDLDTAGWIILQLIVRKWDRRTSPWIHLTQSSAKYWDVVNTVKLNSVALVREQTIPTERPPPVGEVSANFCG